MFGANVFGSSTFGGLSIFSVLINVSEPIVNVFEGDSIADQSVVTEESDIAPLPIDPNVSDSPSTSENIQLNLISHPSVFDATTITDLPVFYPDLVITTEFIGLLLITTEVPSVFDSVATSETTDIRLFELENVFDTVTTSESTTVTAPLAGISVFDSSIVSELVGFSFVFLLSIFDNITTSESVATGSTTSGAISDTVTTSESVTLLLAEAAQLFEKTIPTDFATVILPIDEGNLIQIDTLDS